MPRLYSGLDPGRLRERVVETMERIAAAARRADRDRAEVELVAATKYVPASELDALAAAGLRILGENRAQDLEAKVAASVPGRFTWDFIGQLQSRKVRRIVPLVRLIHSVASESALAQLARHGDRHTEVLLEVNVTGEASKAGLAPAQLASYLERCPVRVGGLMTMPPLTSRPEDNRRHFAALRELADAHGLSRLSMGTSQDFEIAIEEGATLVRVGTTLYEGAAIGTPREGA